MNSTTKTYRSDQTEKTLRKRALDVAVMFDRVNGFDNYNAGYIQALRDLGVDPEYIKIYKRVMTRVRQSYVADKDYYKGIARQETE